MSNAPDEFVYRATLDRIVDGDTFDCILDLGFDVKLHKQRVRLAGIDTPESRTRNLSEKALGLKAKERLKELCIGTFKVKSLGKGKYGRILGIPYTEDGEDICKKLIKEKHAVEYWGGTKTGHVKKMGLGANKMSRIISEEGISLIKNYEGCKLESYQDSVGVWTIAFGHTKDVKEGDSINQDEAEHLLAEEMPEYEGYINNMVKVPLEQNQFDALVCWVYNLGPTNLQESTLLRILNEGDYEGVPEQIKRWNKAGGVTLGGLVKRREAEADLFEGKEWSKV